MPAAAPHPSAAAAAPEWTPERVLTPAVVARVVAEQFPTLAGLPVTPFDAGWDNILFRIGDDVVMRFIHRQIALRGARLELAVLQALPDLPLAVPRPVHVGSPTAEVDWPFWGAPLVPGRELGISAVPDEDRTRMAGQVGAFLRALHAPEVADHVVARLARDEDGPRLLVDQMRRGDAADVARRARVRLEALVATGAWAPDEAVTDLLGRADAATPASSTDAPLVLVHGDLHVRHLLVATDDDGTSATGVIDWGDTALADASVDLALGYAAFHGEARTRFFAAYGPVTPAQELAARTLAVFMSAALAQYATTEGLDALARESLAGLGRAAR